MILTLTLLQTIGITSSVPSREPETWKTTVIHSILTETPLTVYLTVGHDQDEIDNIFAVIASSQEYQG